jgi:peptidoglycan hydrolase-like protein with peptidoglycan-binding domain
MSVRQPRIKQRAPSSVSPSRMASDTRAHQPTPVHNGDVSFERVPRFGHDFSQVRVHTDARAATVARSLDALAFTVGNDIAVAPGQYRPGSDEGQALLAHELTHTLQQTGGVARVQRQENVNTGSPSTGNSPSPGSGRHMISYGSRGKDVVDAQQLLNQHGAAPPLVVDGIFGPKTRQATIEFQKSRGLAPDGIIGPLTWGALESGAPGPQPQPPGPQPPGPQPQPPGPQPVERWTNEDRTMIAAHIQPGVLTAYQASRIEPAVMALADGEYTSFRALLQNAGSAMERAFLCKALAAERSLSDMTDFAATIHGMSDNWLLRNLNVVDLNEADGVERGIIQQYGNSCGPTSVQVIRASADPIYALALRSAGPIEQASEHAVSAPDTIPNQMLAGEQKAILDKHAAAGTGNPATDRTQPTGGAWVEGEMNALASATGVTYQTRIVGTQITLDAALDVLRTNLTAGIFVPIVVGGSVGDTAHYVMAMAISGNRIQIHDVATGDTVWRTEQEFKDSALNLPSGHRMLTAIDVPTAVPTAQPQPATP